MQPQPKQHRIRTAAQIGLIGALIFTGLNYDSILNQYALATYRPGPQLMEFESRIELTQASRAALYRANPQYDAKEAFNSDCDTRPHELELGCYFKGRIFILQIDNESLAPEMDVVGAHELLHAVWSRLSTGEKTKLAAELTQAYEKLGDTDLQDRMAGYAKSEPGEEANELHSILGTEYANLSPVLEEHYAKYFKSRSQVLAAHASYQAVFDSRRLELERELAQIRALKAQLNSINRQLDILKRNDQIESYNALIPRQNSLVDDINDRISRYSAGVDEYNGLSKSLDSQQITDTETRAQ